MMGRMGGRMSIEGKKNQTFGRMDPPMEYEPTTDVEFQRWFTHNCDTCTSFKLEAYNKRKPNNCKMEINFSKQWAYKAPFITLRQKKIMSTYRRCAYYTRLLKWLL